MKITDKANYQKRNPWVVHLYSARQRCENPKVQSYKYYGEKGVECRLSASQIKMLWFRDDAGALKIPSLDRINPRGHYHFNNCRFIEHAANSARANRKHYKCLICGVKHLARGLCGKHYWKLWAWERHLDGGTWDFRRLKKWTHRFASKQAREGQAIDAAILVERSEARMKVRAERGKG